MVDDEVEGLIQYSERRKPLVGGYKIKFRKVDWGQAPADVKIKLDID